MKDNYTFETDFFTIKPMISGGRRFHQVREKTKEERPPIRGTFPNFEDARDFVLTLEQSMRDRESLRAQG